MGRPQRPAFIEPYPADTPFARPDQAPLRAGQAPDGSALFWKSQCPIRRKGKLVSRHHGFLPFLSIIIPWKRKKNVVSGIFFQVCFFYYLHFKAQ